MLLAIDVGNTNIVAGVFDGAEMVADFRLKTEGRATGDELGLTLVGLLGHRRIAVSDIAGVVVSSVVSAMQRTILEASTGYFGHQPMMVGPGVRTGMRILVDDPRQVGADRIVNSIAAHRVHGGPAIVIDLGTATTFDAVGPTGDYLGGAIAPGLLVSVDALVSHAARLNRIDIVAPPSAIGRSTTAAMQSGAVLGYVALIEGLVERMRREMGGEVKVIATGGLAELLAGQARCIDVVDQTLTLTGLRLIWELNQG